MALRPRKQFGQHWLRDSRVLDQILVAADLQPQDCVLEIGPGKGNLTQRLLPKVKAVLAIEVDRDLCALLRQTYAQQSNFQLIEANFLHLDLAAILQPMSPEAEAQAVSQSVNLSLMNQAEAVNQAANINKVVANIPYNITGPILERLLGSIALPPPVSFTDLVLLVQAEVAQRICAAPGSKTFGALSVRMQYLAAVDFICPVPARAFLPPPKVESAVIRLRPRPYPQPAHNPCRLEQIVKLGFATRRKMLRNNLRSLLNPTQLLTIFAAIGIRETARAEDLSVDQWVELSNQLELGLSSPLVSEKINPP
ncbi:MAG: 16S rRNA (adenine(1518)-N(6)/adenine(1519)-N(6))-dimethyltransferase RsmA [Cyanobacteria bacterium P01_H01_bin.121]